MRSKANDFYIYALLDEAEQPFYIGYGRKNRYKDHWRDYLNERETNKFKKKIFDRLYSMGLTYTHQILIDELSFEDALDYERVAIAELGTKYDKTGVLCNLTKGGDGGYTPNNRNFGNDPILKAKLIEYIEQNVKGKPLRAEHIESLRAAALKRIKHGHSGCLHSEKARAVISQKMKGNKNNVGKYKPETAKRVQQGIERYKALPDKRVVAAKLSTKELFVFENQKITQKSLEIPNANCISAVCWGKQKTAHGYVFFFFNNQKIAHYVREGYKIKSRQNSKG